jgi:tetratricopeptide (TPR) repeat protein
MSLRPKTVRRLFILLAAVLVVVGTAAAFYWRNEHAREVKLMAARDAGMAAFKSADYRTALDQLKIYVARDQGKKDVDALYAYGVSRSRIEEPSGKHILEGITVFKTILQLDPGNLECKHRLLDLYARAGYTSDAIDLADKVLTLQPDDAAALRAKCVALEHSRKFEAALDTSEQLNNLDPTDLDQQFTTYRLMMLLKRSPQDLLARAKRMQAAYPNDPRFAMLVAMTYANAADVQSGREWLRKAATQPSPDAAYVRHMVRIFDSLKLYNEAQELLERAAANNVDPQVARLLLQRLWQKGQNASVIDRSQSLDLNSGDANLLAYRALALYESGRSDDAKAIVDALGKRKEDTEAMAWSTALGARFSGAEPKAALAQYQSALSRTPDNAVFRCLVGEAYARMGEMELAIAAWRRAADLSPSWSRPRTLAARALATSNRLNEALKEAQLAYTAMPSTESVILMASIGYKALEQGSIDASIEPDLLTNVRNLQKQYPGEPETLVPYVNLLARAGRRDDAIAAVRGAIANPKEYDQATILRLLVASRTHKLGLDDDLQRLASAMSSGQDTPQLALARAKDLAASGKPLDGLALLESRLKSATTRPVQWQLARTQYKEIIHEPTVASDWITLGDANPDDLAVQTAILKMASSVRSDRDFIARTIERLKAITGSEGQTWKLERARWLISSGSTKDAAEAVNTLSEIVRSSPTVSEARLLLADAQAGVGNLQAAIKELQSAAELEPNNERILIALARQFQEQNRFSDARSYLDRAAGIPDLSIESRWRIAGMIAAQGDTARGIAILESARDQLDTPGQILLSDLYRRQRRMSDAEAIYAKLLTAKPITLDVIRASADFYASQHNRQKADQIVARLGEVSGLKPGAAELYQAEFAERYVSTNAAKSLYIGATLAAPANPSVWRQFTAFHLRTGQFDEAMQTANDGLRTLPDDATFKRLREVAVSASQLLGQDSSLQPIVTYLASAAPGDPACAEFFSSGGDPTSQPIAVSTFASRLKEFAGKYPNSLALQTALVQWHVSQHQLPEAAQVAARTMDLFPTDPSSARAAATLYRDARKWDLAAAAILKWKQRAAPTDDPMPPDIMLAQVRLAQNDAPAAMKVLGAYVSTITASPLKSPLATEILARAQAASGNEDAAKALLSPLLKQERFARSIWITVAASDIRKGDTAAAWLREVAPLVPVEALDQTTELATGWYLLATRTRHEGALEQAATLLDAIVQKPDAPIGAVLLRGSVADRAGDLKSAEEFYRRGLVLQPDQPEALNNLAYLVLLRGGDVNEAQTLASRAVQLSPQSASFYDTLARVQIKLGQGQAALATFEQALKLDPNNLDALIGMATALCDAGKRGSAAGLLAQIDTLVKDKSSLSPQLRRELEALRSTIKASL